MKLKSIMLLSLAFVISACNDSNPSAESQQVDGESGSQINKTSVAPKNVVLILIDDLSHYGVTAYGANRLHSYDGEFTNKEFSTPNIDQLAAGGLRVDRAFAYPICENTRIALMSGKRNDRNYLKPKSQHHSDLTFGDAFQKAGYTTGLYGKWKQTRGTKEIAGKDYISEFGWDDYAAFDVVTEGQRFINPNLVVNSEVFNYNGRTDLDPQTGRRWYGPDIVNRHALQFIEKNKNKPFFLYYPMMLVHDDHKPTPDTMPHSVFDNFPENADYNNKRGDDREYFPDMIEYADKLIGQVVQKLDEEGVRENTLIVVMGDNGTKESFAHILADDTIYPGRKGGNADNGLHVPLILNFANAIPSGENGQYRTYDGLVNLTDIYPTIAEAAGIEMPNAEQIDGISFWQQATGQSIVEPREHIYTWYIGNETYKDKDIVLRYAFNKNFKLYAPDKDFPNGRFFDLRSDLLERVGDTVKEYRWGLLRYSGLDKNKLTAEQQAGYQALVKILKEHEIQAVNKLSIKADKSNLSVGETVLLTSVVTPQQAKRQGVIWTSSDEQILTVNKFGEVSAHQAGSATISIYSWDDAYPVAANRKETFYRNGISASQTFTVK
ncbi:MAG: sulfatase-like hydrolase/transferase [Thalassotalea sp.]